MCTFCLVPKQFHSPTFQIEPDLKAVCSWTYKSFQNTHQVIDHRIFSSFNQRIPQIWSDVGNLRVDFSMSLWNFYCLSGIFGFLLLRKEIKSNVVRQKASTAFTGTSSNVVNWNYSRSILTKHPDNCLPWLRLLRFAVYRSLLYACKGKIKLFQSWSWKVKFKSDI